MRSQPVDRTRPSIAPDVEPLRVRSFPERVHRAKIPIGRVRSTSCSSLRSREDDITVRRQPPDMGPACQIHSVRTLVKMTGCAGQRPGSVWCEALALDLVCAAVNY
jgi:hypothetical protein